MGHVMPGILCGSEARYLKEIKMEILQSTERIMMRAICRVELKDRKTSMDLILILVCIKQ